MSSWIFITGLYVLGVGVMRYFQWKEDHRLDLERLERERRETKFWGFDTDDVDRQYKEKLAEKRSWKDSAADWGWFVAGVVICAIAVAMDEAWDKLTGLLTGFVVLLIGLWWIYHLLKRLDKADHEIAWLNQTLLAVKNHTESMRKGSIEEFVELRDRLDRLEGRRN